MSTPAQIIKGSNLMLFDSDGKSYAYATNHTLTLTAETSDTSSKDHGLWSSAEVTKYSWTVSTENLYTESDYDKMFDAWMAGNKITIKFGIKGKDDTGNAYDNNKTVADGDYDNWNVDTKYYTGSVIITSLTTNANNGENATYSVEFQGVGKFTRVEPQSGV